MSRPLPISELTSRFASCTRGVLEACVRAVAAEAGLDDVIPGFSEREVALIARDMLEAYTLVVDVGAHTFVKARTSGDWALTVLADILMNSARRLRERGLVEESEHAWEDAHSMIEMAAASNDRSRVLWYEDIYSEAAEHLAKRGDRLGLVRQVECLADNLRTDEGSNAINGLRDLAVMRLHVGDYEKGLGLLVAILCNDPADIWTYNAIALRCDDHGFHSLARLAADRGLRLIDKQGDRERLSEQLRRVSTRNQDTLDRSDLPRDAIEELSKRLYQGFEGGEQLSPVELTQKLVPEVASARVKELPPMPDASSLAAIAADLRAVFRESRSVSDSAPPVRPPIRQVVALPNVPQVGRNDPCPCGSGRKFKKCCGNPATPP